MTVLKNVPASDAPGAQQTSMSQNKKRLPEATSFHYFVTINYCNLNITGTVYFTRTGLPRCIPGFHFGIVPITRSASLSR